MTNTVAIAEPQIGDVVWIAPRFAAVEIRLVARHDAEGMWAAVDVLAEEFDNDDTILIVDEYTFCADEADAVEAARNNADYQDERR